MRQKSEARKLEDKRLKLLSFRVTKEEAETIQAAAAANGYGDNLSAYLRAAFLENSSKMLETYSSVTLKYKDRAEERFSEVLTFRVSKEEKMLLGKSVNESGLSMSSYLRKAALGQQIYSRDMTVLKPLLYELQKVGANLNQLMVLCHKGKVTHPNIGEVIALQNDLLQAVLKLIDQNS